MKKLSLKKPSDKNKSLFYKSLSQLQKNVYDVIFSGLKKMEPEISVEAYIEFNEIYEKITHENPELFYVGKKFTVEKAIRGATIKPEYTYNYGEASDLKQKLNAKANQILVKIINEHQSDYDKVLVIHDYLKKNVEYDKDAAESFSDGEEFKDSYTAVGALMNNKCVCAGFSLATKLLCNKAGIECVVVEGEGNNGNISEAHAWNIVKINGYYHHVDVTWDNQFSSDKEMPNYAYLNLDDNEISKDHIWKKEFYPECPIAPYNYFVFTGCLMDSQKQLEKYIYNSMLDETEQIIFKVKQDSMLSKEISNCLDRIVHTASKRCKHVKINKWKYIYISKQLIYTLIIEYK